MRLDAEGPKTVPAGQARRYVLNVKINYSATCFLQTGIQ